LFLSAVGLIVQVEEERLVLALLHELQGFLREEIVRPGLAFELHPLAVAEQVVGVLLVGVLVVEVPEGVLEALKIGPPAVVGKPEAPLSDHGRRIAGVLQELRDGDVLRPERDLRVAADVRVAHVVAGHQGAPGRRADGAPGIVLGEPHPFGGHLVEARGLELLLAVAAQVAPAQVVRVDEDDVGLLLGLRCGEQQENRGEVFHKILYKLHGERTVLA
jgi:hypothetical protein